MAHIREMAVKIIGKAILNGPVEVGAEAGGHIFVDDGNTRPRLAALHHGVIHFDVPGLCVPRPLRRREGNGVACSRNQTGNGLRKSSSPLNKCRLTTLRHIRITKTTAIGNEARTVAW